METKGKKRKAIYSCRSCPFFSISKKNSMPYYCRFYGFVSASYPPELVLYQSTGKRCELISKKKNESESKSQQDKEPNPLSRFGNWQA